MKRLFAMLLAMMIFVALSACTVQEPSDSSTGETELVYRDPEGNLLTGWQILDGEKYCFSQEGLPLSGWITEAGARYWLTGAGKAVTGWQDIDGKRYYFDTESVMVTGWLEEDGESYYFGIDGAMFTGLLNIQGQGYYFTEDGKRYSGWLEKDEKTYYFGADGVMAVGPAEIDGQTHYFSPQGVEVLLVNPWNTVPEGYEVTLVQLTEQDRLEEKCAEALQRMLSDCEAAGYKTMIVSAYRTQEEQEFLYWRKVNRLKEAGLSHSQAMEEAAKEVAVPGTSEHQLGLAVDIIDTDYAYLDEYQANMPAQKWLMEHCYEYGFILRYPVGTTEITGIIFEPWHYRYVGEEIAQEIMNLGITLEEYLGAA